MIPDIYFEPNYGLLCEIIEEGKCETYVFRSPMGTVNYMFIKRVIPTLICGKRYFDITTPYGYGGPFVEPDDRDCKDKLVGDFAVAFEGYCTQNKIVSEFVRFHPVVKNVQDFEEYYDVAYLRNTVGTNLAFREEHIKSELSKSCRRTISRALRRGVGFRVTTKPYDLDQFRTIYYSTMDRVKADKFYYFSDGYFDQCINLCGENIVLVEALYQQQTIAMSLCFAYKKTIHVHLSGTADEFLHLSPSYILRYAIAVWGRENGYQLIHHGGGTSNDPEDKLYQFKKQFGKTKFEYYVGKKIHNRKVYERLCTLMGSEKYRGSFFPAYRATQGDE